MPVWLVIVGGVAAAYLLLLALLLALGRRTDARAWAGLVPDCVVLARRLLGDERVPRAARAALGVLVAYLLLPIDLVPDVLPVVGQLDDAVVAALVLRVVLRAAGEAAIAEHWPGPPRSLAVVLRLAGVRPTLP